MRILALDYGERRIGAAVTDPTGMLAQPIDTVQHTGNRRAALERIAELVRNYEVARIVLGLPLHMDGRVGEQAAEVKRFGAALGVHTGVPVEYLDERWTTLEAERALGEIGIRGARRRERVDSVAAAILLRTFLERRGSGCAD
jgi:putative holliday junction resolvase